MPAGSGLGLQRCTRRSRVIIRAQQMGLQLSDAALNNSVLKLTLSQVAPILPYLFLVLILIFRPKGLLGTREG